MSALDFNRSRWENALIIKYLAQPLVNDQLFPDQRGIDALMAIAVHGDGSPIVPPGDGRWSHTFFFRTSDFGSGYQFGVDLLLAKGTTVFVVEVKSFADPNGTNVKREIVRSIQTMEWIARYLMTPKEELEFIPVLLYSREVSRRLHGDFNYFTEDYLVRKGKANKHVIEPHEWDTKSFQIGRFWARPFMFWDESAEPLIHAMAKSLLFLTWDDVLDALRKSNTGHALDSVIADLCAQRYVYTGRSAFRDYPLVTPECASGLVSDGGQEPSTSPSTPGSSPTSTPAAGGGSADPPP